MMIRFLVTLLGIGITLSGISQASLGVTKLGQVTYQDPINDVWGWANGNREFALVGVEDGLSIVEVTDPGNPVEKTFIPGATSTWRDMKSYQNYAYAVHDRFSGSSDGILVVDMSTIDSANPTFWNRIPFINYQGQNLIYQRAHNIYVDENGYLYLFGANIGQGGALIFDLKPDPTNPTYVGIFDQYYLHDGVVRGDTLWGAAVIDGYFSAINVNTKSVPVELARQNTPSGVSHNIWFSNNNQRVFTTDETDGAYIAEYDVTDLSNITELDRVKSSFGPNVVPHNAHVHNNFLVNSFYTSGLQIVDITEPGIMVETAYYDTSPASGGGFSGAWGAYPYLPSGNILVSDRETGLYIFSSTYPRASYLQATVTNAITGQSLPNSNIEFLNGSLSGTTNLFGILREGQAQSGTFSAEVSKTGFITDTFNVNIQQGQITTRVFPLNPINVGMAELPATLSEAMVYPNPSLSAEGFFIKAGANGNEVLNLTVTNTIGVKVYQQSVLATGEEQKVEHNLAKGSYLLHLSNTQNNSRVFKLLVN